MLQLIRDEVRSGKNDKEIYKKLQEDFGESVLYTPKFDMQTAALWLSPVRLSAHIHTYIYIYSLIFFFLILKYLFLRTDHIWWCRCRNMGLQ